MRVLDANETIEFGDFLKLESESKFKGEWVMSLSASQIMCRGNGNFVGKKVRNAELFQGGKKLSWIRP